MIFTTTICCHSSSNSSGGTNPLTTLVYAANDADALARGVPIGGFYKASGPKSSEASKSAGGTLEPNTMGIKEGVVTENVGLN